MATSPSSRPIIVNLKHWGPWVPITFSERRFQLILWQLNFVAKLTTDKSFLGSMRVTWPRVISPQPILRGWKKSICHPLGWPHWGAWLQLSGWEKLVLVSKVSGFSLSKGEDPMPSSLCTELLSLRLGRELRNHSSPTVPTEPGFAQQCLWMADFQHGLCPYKNREPYVSPAIFLY